MNKAQKRIGVVVGVVILLMLLYPPFDSMSPEGLRGGGYGFITQSSAWFRVNVPLLLTQWLGMLIIGAIAFFVAKDGK